MPITLCADLDLKVLRLINSGSNIESSLKTRGYLTLEVLYASRRFHSLADHAEEMLRMLLEN